MGVCAKLWPRLGANLMNAVGGETDALCKMAKFSGCVFRSFGGTSRRGEHLAGHEIMHKKRGKPKKKKNANCSVCYFMSKYEEGYVYVLVCVCVCVCGSSQVLVFLFEPFLFCFSFLALPALAISVQALGTQLTSSINK